MQSLIPSTKAAGDESNAAEDDSPEVDADGKETKESVAKSNSSKAATVEQANRHIRSLNDRDVAQRKEILTLKRQMDELRKRLGEQPCSSNGDDKSSPASAAAGASPEPMDVSTSPEASKV
jgi:predicted RNase H-like nuclease (RuvC/YqgF family)